MYNRHSFTQFDAAHRRRHHPFMQSIFRAPVNVYKTDDSYELLVFAPGRVKENFNVKTKGTELTVSYTPTEGLTPPDWIKKNTAAEHLNAYSLLMKISTQQTSKQIMLMVYCR